MIQGSSIPIETDFLLETGGIVSKGGWKRGIGGDEGKLKMCSDIKAKRKEVFKKEGLETTFNFVSHH